MSPEPTQEPIEQSLQAPDLNVDAPDAADSDSEDEEAGAAGYLPLSQVPIDGDNLLDEDEDDEWISAPTSHSVYSAPDDEPQEAENPESVEVWSTRSSSNIDLDAEKINQVKSMMSTFTLPNTAIPEWAHTVSEEQWKDSLIDRIKEMQSRNS